MATSRICTVRVSSSITNSTYSAAAARCPHAGSHRPGCRRPGRPGTAARSATPAAVQARARPRPGSAGSSPPPPGTQAEQLALDAQVPPARVLPRNLLHQDADLVRDRRTSRRVRIGPLLADQALVPGQQGARGYDPVQPQAAGQQPGQGGEYGAVSPVWSRAGDLPPQHRDFVAEGQCRVRRRAGGSRRGVSPAELRPGRICLPGCCPGESQAGRSARRAAGFSF